MIKRIFFTVLLPLLFLGVVHAQKFEGGFYGGLTASQIDNDSYFGFNKLGLTAGAFIERPIMENLHWQMEVKFTMRGAYKRAMDNDPTIDLSQMSYIEIPLSVHYLFTDNIQVGLGFSPDVLISQRYEDEDGLLNPQSYPALRSFGINVFGDVIYWMNEHHGVGIRYTYSAIPFYVFDAAATRYRYKGYFHNVLQLTYHYQFHRP